MELQSVPTGTRHKPTLGPFPSDAIPPSKSMSISASHDSSSKSGSITSSSVQTLSITPTEVPSVGNIDEEVLPAEERKDSTLVVSAYVTIKEMLLSSYLNMLLVLVPAGIALGLTRFSPITVFVVNAVAIIPLAALLSFATESIASSTTDNTGALLNVTFGNAVELIILLALSKGEIRLVQATLIGSILADLLLVLGMCFLIGGLRFREQQAQMYNNTMTQMSACLMSLSVLSLLLPTAFHASFSNSTIADIAVLQISRGSSVILLLLYILYLFFQFKSHAYLCTSTSQHVVDEENRLEVSASVRNKKYRSPRGENGNLPTAPSRLFSSHRRARSLPNTFGSVIPPLILIEEPILILGFNQEAQRTPKAHISRIAAIILLLVSTCLVSVCADFMIGSIQYLVTNTGINQAFIGLVILPIIGTATENITAVTVASKNKMDLAISVAVGSSIQIALFLTPLVVLLAWALHTPLSLHFTLFETVALFVSAFIVNFLVLDGRSNYLEGALLVVAYMIIGLAAGFYPGPGEERIGF